MARVNLTLDENTFRKLGAQAKRIGVQRAAVARMLILEGIARRERAARMRKLAGDYAEGKGDILDLLEDFDAGQLGLMGHEED